MVCRRTRRCGTMLCEPVREPFRMVMHRMFAAVLCLMTLAGIPALRAAEPPQSQPAGVNPSFGPLSGPRRSGERPTRAPASRPARAERPDRADKAGPEVGSLTDEQIERLMAFLKLRFPLMHQRFENA